MNDTSPTKEINKVNEAISKFGFTLKEASERLGEATRKAAQSLKELKESSRIANLPSPKSKFQK